MKNKYYLKDDQFIIEDYDKQKPFASFLPGVAGLNGIPMWVYYTNRGQGIAGFGVENKDGSILDFVPANQAYRRTETVGFRTFIKKGGRVHEIFSSASIKQQPRQMNISANSFGFVEENTDLDLRIEVKYFTVTNKPYPGLVRKLTLSSLSGLVVDVEVIDGLMTLWPYKNDNAIIKDMSNLAVAWFEVYNVEKNLPFYRNRSTTSDSAEVGIIEAGHFYAAYSSVTDGPLPVFYDPDVVFGNNTSLTRAENFEKFNIPELLKEKQVSANKIPCAYSALTGRISEPVIIISLVGKMNHVDQLNEAAKAFSVEYFQDLERKAQKLGESLSQDVAGKTAYPMFDAYVRQSYLDNLLRGGYPLVFEGKDGPIVYHVYSRIHGDMEREYNDFHVEPAYYSQGIGAYRDVNQNRRNDIFFVKEAGIYNVRQFMELIQLDGQNPLSIKGSTLTVAEPEAEALLRHIIEKKEVIALILSKSFTPGKLMTTLDDYKVVLDMDKDEFLKEVLKNSKQEIQAAYGHGYWVDHWTYNMDLVDNYLNIYPDRFEELLYKDIYRFFLSPELVLPRRDKYVLNKEGKVRQYDAVIRDQERIDALGIDPSGTNWQKSKDGTLVTTTLFGKMFSLVMNKITNMDPSAIGIMMNTDKPGWNDAMNGLPGLFGSGTSETIELKRIVEFLTEGHKAYGRALELPEELAAMTKGYMRLLSQYDDGHLKEQMVYEESQSLKEAFNEAIKFGTTGKNVSIDVTDLTLMLEALLRRLVKAIQLAIKMGDGIPPSYLVHEARAYQVVEGKRHPVNGLENVVVTAWKVRALPLYLEAPARYLKQSKDKKIAMAMFEKIRNSGMYDAKLGMYVTSESLEEESLEIGRARAFTAGWLERESVFMHMEYKYLLGLLKGGLWDEFFQVIKTALPPFMDPEVYGRSTLENSSFIASSRNPNS